MAKRRVSCRAVRCDIQLAALPWKSPQGGFWLAAIRDGIPAMACCRHTWSEVEMAGKRRLGKEMREITRAVKVGELRRVSARNNFDWP
jgi:hypothetical protein